MIVDSSALPEQVVDTVIRSASAPQDSAVPP
jgi:Delta 1-pyrroline-5-carboxylate dehydrogenase